MRRMKSAIEQELERLGIYPRQGFRGLVEPQKNPGDFNRMAMDEELPYGAPTLPNNVGIPWQYLSYIDREVIRTILADTVAQELFPLEVRGPWNLRSIQRTRLEHGGFIADYQDYSHEGNVSFTVNLPPIDFYMYQTVISVGDLEQEDYSSFGFNAMTEKQMAAADIMWRAANYMFFFGVLGQNTFGIANHPYANPAISVVPDPDAGNTVLFSEMTALGLYNQIRALLMTLTSRSFGRITARSNLILAASPEFLAGVETAANNYGLISSDFLSKAFPNLRTVPVPEFSTEVNGESEIVMLIAPNFAGVPTGRLYMNSRLKNHGPVRELSSIKEKESAGVGGLDLTHPMGVATMLGDW